MNKRRLQCIKPLSVVLGVYISFSAEPLRHLMQCLQKQQFNTNTEGLCSDVGNSRGHRVNKTKGVAKFKGVSHLPAAQSFEASSKSTHLSRTFPSFTPSPPVTQRSSRADDSLPVSATVFPLVSKQSPMNKRYVAKLLIDIARRRRQFSQTNWESVKISLWGIRCQNDLRACGQIQAKWTFCHPNKRLGNIYWTWLFLTGQETVFCTMKILRFWEIFINRNVLYSCFMNEAQW